jgi:hypothetical protein
LIYERFRDWKKERGVVAGGGKLFEVWGLWARFTDLGDFKKQGMMVAKVSSDDCGGGGGKGCVCRYAD